MLVDEATLEVEVQRTIARLTSVAEGLTNDGLLAAASVVGGGVQTIRLLWTQLHPAVAPPAPPPALALVSPEDDAR